MPQRCAAVSPSSHQNASMWHITRVCSLLLCRLLCVHAGPAHPERGRGLSRRGAAQHPAGGWAQPPAAAVQQQQQQQCVPAVETHSRHSAVAGCMVWYRLAPPVLQQPPSMWLSPCTHHKTCCCGVCCRRSCPTTRGAPRSWSCRQGHTGGGCGFGGVCGGGGRPSSRQRLGQPRLWTGTVKPDQTCA